MNKFTQRIYWVLHQKLLAGRLPASGDDETSKAILEYLQEMGVRSIINLTESHEQNAAGAYLTQYAEKMKLEEDFEIQHRRFPIQDYSIPSEEQLENMLDYLEAELGKEQVVYVHCWGGAGRTGTVIACFLKKHLAISGEEALLKLNELIKETAIKHSPETEEQRAFVK